MSRTGARIPSISSPEGNDDDDENEHRLIFSSVLSRTPTTDDDKVDDENNDDHSRSLSSSLPSPLLLHSCIFFLSVYVLRISFINRESSYSHFRSHFISSFTASKSKHKRTKTLNEYYYSSSSRAMTMMMWFL
jgi:hypothetical protein